MAQARRITIRELLMSQGEIAGLRLLAGESGLDRYIDHPRMQKPSLAFAGFIEHLNDYRLQVIGQTELHYLTTRPKAEQRRVGDAVFDMRLAGVVITRDQTPPDIILEAARRTDTPLMVTPQPSSEFMTGGYLVDSYTFATAASAAIACPARSAFSLRNRASINARLPPGLMESAVSFSSSTALARSSEASLNLFIDNNTSPRFANAAASRGLRSTMMGIVGTMARLFLNKRKRQSPEQLKNPMELRLLMRALRPIKRTVAVGPRLGPIVRANTPFPWVEADGC